MLFLGERCDLFFLSGKVDFVRSCLSSELNLAVELYMAFEELKCFSCTVFVMEQYVIPILACYTRGSREMVVHNCWVMQTSRQQNFLKLTILARRRNSEYEP